MRRLIEMRDGVRASGPVAEMIFALKGQKRIAEGNALHFCITINRLGAKGNGIDLRQEAGGLGVCRQLGLFSSVRSVLQLGKIY